MLVKDSTLPDNVKRALIYDHGPSSTIEEIVAKPDSVLVRSANVGSKTIRLLREYAATI
jgi:hypothetical protein